MGLGPWLDVIFIRMMASAYIRYSLYFLNLKVIFKKDNYYVCNIE